MRRGSGRPVGASVAELCCVICHGMFCDMHRQTAGAMSRSLLFETKAIRQVVMCAVSGRAGPAGV